MFSSLDIQRKNSVFKMLKCFGNCKSKRNAANISQAKWLCNNDRWWFKELNVIYPANNVAKNVCLLLDKKKYLHVEYVFKMIPSYNAYLTKFFENTFLNKNMDISGDNHGRL